MSKMISVAKGFQYSVNIGYDLNHIEMLQNFIPTKTSLELLGEIIRSTNDTSTERARVLVGAYGRGKSHIVLAILSVLMRKEWKLFTKLKQQVNLHPQLNQLVKDFYATNKKFLPVIINGSSTSIQQAFILGLESALKENNLTDYLPETNFQAAVNAIAKWKKDYPTTYKSFKREIHRPVETFIDDLLNYDINTYKEFEDIYPRLTSGSVFNPFLGFDVTDLFESVAKGIESFGYNGIFVVYDEFSKYLEANIKNIPVSDTKMLQDFAEKCNRSRQHQLHLLLISHKEIANYIDKLPKQKTDGWRGVSERFKHLHVNNNFSQTYEIIATVIKKDPKKWDKFQNRYKKNFKSLLDRYANHSIFSDISRKECEETIKNCYPLHPVSTFILPRLSERIAQNERTLFTFLSANGVSTLQSFLNDYNDDDFKVLTPDVIFDYFDPLLRKESIADENYREYSLAKTLLQTLIANSIDTKIIKTLALIYILAQFDKVKPTVDEIIDIFSIDYSPKCILDAVDRLIDQNYIYLKSSNNFLRLKQTAGVDLKQAINDSVERLATRFSIKDTLNDALIDNFMYPARYNDSHEMTRYFSFEFINADEISSDTDLNLKIENSNADGIIYGIIPGQEYSLRKIQKLLLTASVNCDRVVFILPRENTDIYDVAARFNAVMELRKSAEGDNVLFDEYQVIYEDLRDILLDFTSNYTRPEKHKSYYIYNGEIQDISRKAQLTALLSTICDTVYSKTPVIINEAINKHDLSGTAYTSRTKIIAGLLRNSLEKNLGFSGTGQEVSMLRSTLIRTKVLIDENDDVRINLHTGDKNLDRMLETITRFIESTKRKKYAEFSELYRVLTTPEKKIGIRKPLVLIYLAAILHIYRDQVLITNNIQFPLYTNTLLQIEAEPHNFRLQYLDWNPEKQEYIKALDRTFEEYIISAEKTLGSYEYIALAMKRWYMSLSKFSKETEPNEKIIHYKGLIKLLQQNTNSYDLLFQKLPKVFGQTDIGKCLANEIRKAKDYYDSTLQNLTKNLIQSVCKIFSSQTKHNNSRRMSLTSIIKDWCEKLDNEVFEQLFENGTERCLKLFRGITNNEESFVLELARIATDLRVEDWSDQTISQFDDRLREFKRTAESFCKDSKSNNVSNTNSYSLTYVDEHGVATTKRFKRVLQSQRGKLLQNSILSDLDSMGQSISEQEKRQILMEILTELC